MCEGEIAGDLLTTSFTSELAGLCPPSKEKHVFRLMKKIQSTNQKTGASFRNNLLSSLFTQRVTAFAAPIAALLGNRGDKAIYNSNG